MREKEKKNDSSMCAYYIVLYLLVSCHLISNTHTPLGIYHAEQAMS